MHYPLDVNEYELENLIGEGATAKVYVALCKKNHSRVAIKIIDLEHCPVSIETLRQEVAFWSSCESSNVVEYYGSFIAGHNIYLLMEYMSGGSLYEIMRFSYPNGFQNESYIATNVLQILQALKYLGIFY